jgi:glutamine amidotransferase-like uncharacterized protein
LVVLLIFAAACRPNVPNPASTILLFNGNGTSPNDVKAVEAILNQRRLAYSTINSRQLNSLSEPQLSAYRLLIIPGGNYITMSDGLTSQTATNIHNAVGNGLNYLGICAGGLLAGAGTNQILNLTDGVRFDFYAEVNRGIHKAAVPITTIDGPVLEHYWEDGPQFTDWGTVVAKYPDGTPAVVEGKSGSGWVILCGIHPEAPENWRRGMTFKTSATTDNAYAAELIEAALKGESLPHY